MGMGMNVATQARRQEGKRSGPERGRAGVSSPDILSICCPSNVPGNAYFGSPCSTSKARFERTGSCEDRIPLYDMKGSRNHVKLSKQNGAVRLINRSQNRAVVEKPVREMKRNEAAIS